MKGKGDCYQVHGRAIAFDGIDGLLCHGEVYHEVTGWHGHCWIEQGDTVTDMANGKNTSMPKELYYALGKVRNVIRYTSIQTRKKIVETKNWGAW